MSHERAIFPLNHEQTSESCPSDLQHRYRIFGKKSEIKEEKTCSHFHLPGKFSFAACFYI